MKLRRAFSLIELSIVILIVGVLVAGIYQSMSLYNKMKLEAARSITQGSTVNKIYGLSLWLDATAIDAFNASYDNNDPVALWGDTNPQQSTKSDASQATESLQPLYASSGINGLPAIKCDGIDDQLAIASGSPYLPASMPVISNNFTVFLVAAPTTTHEIDAQANNNASGTSGQKYAIYATDGDNQYGNSTIAGMGISIGTNGVSVYEHSGSYIPSIAVYNGSNNLQKASIITVAYNNKTPTIFVNGILIQTGLSSIKNLVFPSGQFCSGTHGAFDGYIGEVIVYDTSISATKRQQVERYLGKKWGITVPL